MKRLIRLLVMVFLIVFDQLTKYLAYTYLRGADAKVLIKGVFELRYLENRGAAFGIMQDQTWFFVACTIIILAIAAICFRRFSGKQKFKYLTWLLVLISAGAIGNMIDRIIRGFVVDFFYFSLIDFPVFNVADCYVTISEALFIFLIFFFYKEDDLKELWKKDVDSESNGEP